MKLFSGSASKKLTEKICENLDVDAGKVFLDKFPSGERFCKYEENIRKQDIFIIQSISRPTNDNLLELLIMCDAARRASANSITVICPYLAYLRADRKVEPRTPISAKLILDLIEKSGADRIIGMELHFSQAQGMINIPFDNIYGGQAIFDYVNQKYEDYTILSPDVGGLKRVEAIANPLGKEFGFIHKRRVNAETTTVENIIADINGKNVVIYDDMTESCSTIINAARACWQNGAKAVVAAIAHNLITEKGEENMSLVGEGFVNEFISTDTVENDNYLGLKIVSVAPMLAEVVRRTESGQSISGLFKYKGH